MKPSTSNHRQSTGNLGESIAAAYLQKKGYHIIERNYRAGHGEIDIIASVGATIVFVEVKARIGNAFGKPEEAVQPRKLQEVIRTARYYASTHDIGSVPQRVDLVAIALTQEKTCLYIRHLENISG